MDTNGALVNGFSMIPDYGNIWYNIDVNDNMGPNNDLMLQSNITPKNDNTRPENEPDNDDKEDFTGLDHNTHSVVTIRVVSNMEDNNATVVDFNIDRVGVTIVVYDVEYTKDSVLETQQSNSDSNIISTGI